MFGVIYQYIREYARPNRPGYGFAQSALDIKRASEKNSDLRRLFRQRDEEGLVGAYNNPADALNEEELFEIRDMVVDWFPLDEYKSLPLPRGAPHSSRRYRVTSHYYDRGNIAMLADRAVEIACGRRSLQLEDEARQTQKVAQTNLGDRPVDPPSRDKIKSRQQYEKGERFDI